MADYPVQMDVAGDAVNNTGVGFFMAIDMGSKNQSLSCSISKLDVNREADYDERSQMCIDGDPTDNTGVGFFMAGAAPAISFESRNINHTNYWDNELSNQKMQGGVG